MSFSAGQPGPESEFDYHEFAIRFAFEGPEVFLLQETNGRELVRDLRDRPQADQRWSVSFDNPADDSRMLTQITLSPAELQAAANRLKLAKLASLEVFTWLGWHGLARLPLCCGEVGSRNVMSRDELLYVPLLSEAKAVQKIVSYIHSL